jgi:hypothetical protein
LPPGKQDIDGGVRGTDFYDRIRDVIDRILERRDKSESAVADAYLAERDKPPKAGTVKLGSGKGRRRGGAAAAARSPKARNRVLDLSWKEAGRNFPKHSSRVGPEYQAVELPPSTTFVPGSNESDSM